MRFEYHNFDSVLWIHLDDGRVVKIEGSSYEEVSLSHKFLTIEERRAEEHARQGRREYYRNLRRNKRSPGVPVSVFGKMLEEEYIGAIRDYINDTRRMMFPTDENPV